MPRGQQSAHTAVTEALRTRVTSGEWCPGTRLPSRTVLAAEYGVGEAVVQRAQEALIRDGLLEGRVGSGTYVPEPRPRLQLHLDPDAPFGVRPGSAGQWSVLCRRPGPVTMAYFVQDRPILLARPGTPDTAEPGSPRLRAATVSADEAQVLGLLRDDSLSSQYVHG
ncbi:MULTISPECIES: GntR family transcriptional regulator [unclassified Kitasatospora]|uniref:GntR family transcriptional regulator n=1 Tax=unclassified Kitasatospora TaxID=2633591 RepID=UPI00070B6812|nr:MULTISPECIES: winged helix-turn-helix domain-containing protein [unclassified Kitasatospora]KQV20822.1 hypothetical protein ASC99_20140 [Kitasatospora sp. Root107]KRB60522.1 hypothetical protein ASE03_13040 [Kitasatospora sp. Root187]